MALRIKPNDYQPPSAAPAELPIEEPIEDVVEEASVDDMLPMAPIASGGQVDPEAARYFGREHMCQGCIHFLEPSSCEIVSGEIDPEGICSLFVPDAAIAEDAMVADVPADVAAEPMQDIPIEE